MRRIIWNTYTVHSVGKKLRYWVFKQVVNIVTTGRKVQKLSSYFSIASIRLTEQKLRALLHLARRCHSFRFRSPLSLCHSWTRYSWVVQSHGDLYSGGVQLIYPRGYRPSPVRFSSVSPSDYCHLLTNPYLVTVTCSLSYSALHNLLRWMSIHQSITRTTPS